MPEDQSPTPFPEDLTTLDADALEAAETAAIAEAATLREIPTADMTDAQVDRLEAVGEFLDRFDTEATRRTTEAEARESRAAAAADRIAARDGDPVDPSAPVDGADPAPVEPAAAPGPEPVGVQGEVVEPGTAAPAPTAIAASAGRGIPQSSARRMRQPANPQPVQAGTTQGFMSLTAAANIGGGTGIEAGADLGDIPGAVEAFIGATSAFPRTEHPAKNQYDKRDVAHINRHFGNLDGLVDTNQDFANPYEVLRAASRESRLTGGSLVASGGWCAPSENLYGMCANETLDGILDLPTIGVTRGGINYTPGPDFADIYTAAGFSQTETEAIAGTEKACSEVDCPDFQEVRLDAVGICVKAPILTESAYPELIARWLEGTVIANQHKVNARIVSGMRTALGAALAPVLTGTPVTWSVLTAMEWHIEMERQAYRLSESESLEVICPRWLRVAIRADLANRMGIGAASVSNAQIAEHFADRGAAVQWILGYLEVATPLTSVAIPATVEIMVYPAGTFVKGTKDVLSLAAIYDTADLITNMYTAAFVEDGVLLAKMCWGGKRITLPVNVNGMLGAAQLDDNWGGAQVENVGAAAA